MSFSGVEDQQGVNLQHSPAIQYDIAASKELMSKEQCQMIFSWPVALEKEAEHGCRALEPEPAVR